MVAGALAALVPVMAAVGVVVESAPWMRLPVAFMLPVVAGLALMASAATEDRARTP